MALVNTGDQGWYVLEGYNTADSTLSGTKMPNIRMISPDAIVPESAAITYNQAVTIAPSGGADGDIWYNDSEADPTGNGALYKRIVGVWTLLTNRVINTYYVPPIVNLTDCPL